MTIDQSKFAELEYATLSKEIETSKANMFKLAVGGSAVIPAAQSVANSYSMGVITLALPLIVVVLVLLFLAENHAVMRAGTYILQEIETKVDVVSVALAARYALREFGLQGQYVAGGLYVFLGAGLSFVLYSQARTDTKPATSA